MMESELDRLNGMLRARDDEIDRWRLKYEELESQGVTVIQEKVTYLTQVEWWSILIIVIGSGSMEVEIH